MSLPVAGGLELDDLQGPFQPKPFDDSVIAKGWRNRLPREVVVAPNLPECKERLENALSRTV